MTLALTMPWSISRPAQADEGGIVSLDYGLASTMLMLGVTPAAVVARADWQQWVVDPPMPESVADLGTATEINLEVLARLKPSLILSTPFLAASRSQLETIAPVREVDIYGGGREALPASIVATRDLGKLLRRESQATAFLAHAEANFADCNRRIAELSAPPVALVTLMDERHVRIYGGSGLYQGTLDRLGVKNAWQAETNFWGFQTITIEQLISLPENTHLMIFEPLTPPDILQRLDDSPLWHELPFARAGRVSVLPGVLMFGMVREAIRFAELLTDRLEQLA
ncbi:iron complex transport system substrate-binding protein [Neorhizobium huautlense]|uniref:Iron complex transport system substrate-binding protein n=1 Tax=Neorhizobium huautlense TaxID=67774 RepID=A0ABT9Q1W7_9HYPH|nr:ABC transporter substrate-binding protein [Neorhizobium huautlense]MDP9840682.1 iron complex transport system substrate-binding protein [Neorhizobium huautlense]